jgi:hypothetical protein
MMYEDLYREIEHELTLADLSYHVLQQQDKLIVERYDLVIGSLPTRYQGIKRWTVMSRDDWHQLREQLMPRSDIAEAYAIYLAMDDTTHAGRMSKLLALRER